MKRRRLMSLSDAQALYGIERTTFRRPRYVPEGFCEWCGSEITNKRRSSCCCKECTDEFNIATSPVYYANQGSRGGYGNHILRRDNYTCRLCNTPNWEINENDIPIPTTNGWLDVHHKIYIEDGGTDAPENLITLCRGCHRMVHREHVILK